MGKRTLLSIVTLLVFLPSLLSAGDKPIVVVFDMEVKGVRLKRGLTERLCDYLTGKIAASGSFQVVPRKQIKERLRKAASESHKVCYDESCQIEMGRELAAQKILSSRVMKIGSRCIVSLTLFDLKTSASEGGSEGEGKCSEEGILQSIRQAVQRLPGVTGKEAEVARALKADKQSNLMNLSNWEILDGRWWTRAGAIHGSGGSIILKHEPVSDFVFEVTVEHVAGWRTGIGIVFRESIFEGGNKRYRSKTSDSQGFGFNFELNGTYQPFKGVGGNWYRVFPDRKKWKAAEEFKADRVRMRIEGRGSSFKIFADERLIDSFTDSAHPSGSFGFWVQDPYQTSRFSDIRVYRPGKDKIPPPSRAKTPQVAPMQEKPVDLTDLSKWEVLDGNWRMEKGTILGSGGHILLRGEPFGDFVLEMTVEHVSGNKLGIAGDFRTELVPGGAKRFRLGTADIQGLAFNFTLGGTFMPFKGIGGKWYKIHGDWKEWKPAKELNKSSVRVRIEATGRTCRFYAGGKLLDEFSDPDFMEGTLLLWVQDPAQTTRFSDIKLRRRQQ